MGVAEALECQYGHFGCAWHWRGLFFGCSGNFLEITNVQSQIKLDVYFDVAAVVTTLVILGKYLEAKAKGSASEAIKNF